MGLAESCAEDAVIDETDDNSLCCGRAGQGFAALTMYRATWEERWLVAAHRLAGAAVAGSRDEGGSGHRLLGGRLGVTLLVTELEDPARAAMPVYQQIV